MFCFKNEIFQFLFQPEQFRKFSINLLIFSVNLNLHFLVKKRFDLKMLPNSTLYFIILLLWEDKKEILTELPHAILNPAFTLNIFLFRNLISKTHIKL